MPIRTLIDLYKTYFVFFNYFPSLEHFCLLYLSVQSMCVFVTMYIDEKTFLVKNRGRDEQGDCCSLSLPSHCFIQSLSPTTLAINTFQFTLFITSSAGMGYIGFEGMVGEVGTFSLGS